MLSEQFDFQKFTQKGSITFTVSTCGLEGVRDKNILYFIVKLMNILIISNFISNKYLTAA